MRLNENYKNFIIQNQNKPIKLIQKHKLMNYYVTCII